MTGNDMYAKRTGGVLVRKKNLIIMEQLLLFQQYFQREFLAENFLEEEASEGANQPSLPIIISGVEEKGKRKHEQKTLILKCAFKNRVSDFTLFVVVIILKCT